MNHPSRPNADIRARLGLRPIINVSGTMTALGASIALPEVVTAIAEVLPQFVEVHDLQRKASGVIAAACGAEAGYVTASASGAITLAVAACMTGDDPAAIERLPDASGLRDGVAIQMGHMVSYGASVAQGVRLAGARVAPVGTATLARAYQLEAALDARAAAVLHVVSHHVVDHGQIPLATVVEVARSRGAPVIVDAASEYDLKGFLAAGADLVIYSAHKFLGGPTAGIVAGRAALVRACYMQNGGIGRGMKVGKESIVGTMAALEAWRRRDHAAARQRETTHLQQWRDGLAGLPGVRAEIAPDPTGNPLDRLRLHVDPAAAGLACWDLAMALAAGDPPVIVRDHLVEHGFFELDPCNLHDGEAATALERIRSALDAARQSPLAGDPRARLLAHRRKAEEGLRNFP